MDIRPRLPVELLREVLIHARSHGSHTLASLISVCRLFQSEAEQCLYESVDMQALWPAKSDSRVYIPGSHPPKFRSSDAAKQAYTDIFVSFLTTVKTNERLAGYVKAFISYEDDRLDSSRDGFWHTFAGALANLRNMKMLIFQHIAADLQGRRHVLFSCRARLEVLSWACGPDDWEDLYLFLETQPSITVLHTDWRQHTVLSYRFLPRLETFIGDYDAVWTVCQNHDLTSLYWVTDIVDPMEFPSQAGSLFLDCLPGLKTLELPEDSDEFLPVIAPELKNLERLNVVGSQLSDRDMIKITNLIYVRMSRFHGEDDDPVDKAAYVRNCFDNLSRLQTLEMYDRGQCWRYMREDIDNPKKIQEELSDWRPINLKSYHRLRKGLCR